jgi:hypothetical protein
VTSSNGNLETFGDIKVRIDASTDAFFVDSDIGATSIRGDLLVNTDKFKVIASSGNIISLGSLTVAQGVQFNEALTVASGINAADSKFTVNTTGNAVIKGTLTTGADDDFKVSATGGIEMKGGITISPDIFSVTTSGDTVTKGTFLTAATNFEVDGSTGNVKT